MYQLLKTNPRTSCTNAERIVLDITLFAKWKVLLMAVFLSATKWMREPLAPKMNVKLELQFLS